QDIDQMVGQGPEAPEVVFQPETEPDQGPEKAAGARLGHEGQAAFDHPAQMQKVIAGEVRPERREVDQQAQCGEQGGDSAPPHTGTRHGHGWRAFGHDAPFADRMAATPTARYAACGPAWRSRLHTPRRTGPPYRPGGSPRGPAPGRARP